MRNSIESKTETENARDKAKLFQYTRHNTKTNAIVGVIQTIHRAYMIHLRRSQPTSEH